MGASEITMKRMRGRIVFKHAPAPLLIDRRGAIAVNSTASKLFSHYEVSVNSVSATSAKSDCQIGLQYSSLTWRHDANVEALLHFVLTEMLECKIRVSSIEIALTYIQPEAEPFERMIGEMSAQIAAWPRLALPRERILDVGFMIDVKVGEHPIYIEVGPMKAWQLEANIFDGKGAPDGALPERAWYLYFKDKDGVTVTGNYGSLRSTIEAELEQREQFAQSFFGNRK
jgi:hypothetical protein